MRDRLLGVLGAVVHQIEALNERAVALREELVPPIASWQFAEPAAGLPLSRFSVTSLTPPTG
jgi:hypothetical protein